jgi:hypothetical protein
LKEIPQMSSAKHLPLAWVALIVAALALTIWMRESDTATKIELKLAMLGDFEVISDPFDRPKIYRHKELGDLNPGAKNRHQELQLVVTSDGEVILLKLTNKMEPDSTSASIVRLLAQDRLLEFRSTPCPFSPADKYKYQHPAASSNSLSNNDGSIVTLTRLADDEARNDPYVYRIDDQTVDHKLEGPSLNAFKQTFRLAELIRKTAM